MPEDSNNKLGLGHRIKKRRPRKPRYDCRMTKEEKFKLIKSVKRFPVLYKHPVCKDSQLRNRYWEQVANDVGYSVQVCKYNWNALRTNYKRVKLTEQTRPNDVVERNPLSFSSALSFLENSSEKTTGNVAVETAEDDVTVIEVHQNPSNPVSSGVEQSPDSGHNSLVDTSQRESDSMAEHQSSRKSTRPSNGIPTTERVSSLAEHPDAAVDAPSLLPASLVPAVHQATKSSPVQALATVIFGQYVQAKLEKLDSDTRELAIYEVSKVLSKATLGLLKNSFE